MAIIQTREEIHFATPVDEESLTEQEHKDSCDINIMMRKINNGQQIRTANSELLYGYDDTTMDGLQHRIMKQKIEQDLQQISQDQEFTEAELNVIPESVKQKFKLRKKVPQNDPNEKQDPKTQNPDPTLKPDSNPS